MLARTRLSWTSSSTASKRRFDRLALRERRGDPLGQQSRAHGGGRAIDHGQQRAVAAAVTDGARDFQTAARRLVDLQELAHTVGHQAVEVIEGGALCFQQIVEDGACRADGRGVPLGESKALQTGRLEELGQIGCGRCRGKTPRRGDV